MTTRGEAQAAAAAEHGLQSATWRALGTSVQLVVTDHLDEARAAVERVLADIDLAASRFRPDSELSMTDLGYDRTYQLLSRDGPAVTVVRQAGGWQRIQVDGLRVRAPLGLDLGATAKGLAADLAAAALAEICGSALVSLGGELATCGDQQWPVLVTDTADPASTDQSGQVITLLSGGLATSGTKARRWTRGGRLLHHLLDPRTGLPTDGPWQTASVLADSCVLANVASTAAIVSGTGAVAWLRERGFSARLVDHHGVVTRVGAWP